MNLEQVIRLGGLQVLDQLVRYDCNGKRRIFDADIAQRPDLPGSLAAITSLRGALVLVVLHTDRGHGFDVSLRSLSRRCHRQDKSNRPAQSGCQFLIEHAKPLQKSPSGRMNEGVGWQTGAQVSLQAPKRAGPGWIRIAGNDSHSYLESQCDAAGRVSG